MDRIIMSTDGTEKSHKRKLYEISLSSSNRKVPGSSRKYETGSTQERRREDRDEVDRLSLEKCVGDHQQLVWELVVVSGFVPWYDLEFEFAFACKEWRRILLDTREQGYDRTPYKAIYYSVSSLNGLANPEDGDDEDDEDDEVEFVRWRDLVPGATDPRRLPNFDTFTSREKAKQMVSFHATSIRFIRGRAMQWCHENYVHEYDDDVFQQMLEMEKKDERAFALMLESFFLPEVEDHLKRGALDLKRIVVADEDYEDDDHSGSFFARFASFFKEMMEDARSHYEKLRQDPSSTNSKTSDGTNPKGSDQSSLKAQAIGQAVKDCVEASLEYSTRPSLSKLWGPQLTKHLDLLYASRKDVDKIETRLDGQYHFLDH